MYSIVLVSGGQQSESVMHTHITTLIQILVPYWLLQSTEQIFWYYTVGLRQLPILYMVDGEKVETVTDFIFLGSKITVDGDFSHEIKTLLERKDMTNLDSVL